MDLSIVAPAHNEEENVETLVKEISNIGKIITELGMSFEFIVVDDGSTDNTQAILKDLMTVYPFLRVLAMQDTPPGSGNGQSAAFKAGFEASTGRFIAVLDADLQNDPADLPQMLKLIRNGDVDMVQGDRSANRRDTLGRRAASWVGRTFRQLLLKDSIKDTGCSLRVMKREIALSIPLEYRGMHRFIPVTAKDLGYHVVEVPVNHRPRIAGQPKYGVFNRAIPALVDCLAVRWMRNRRQPTTSKEITTNK